MVPPRAQGLEPCHTAAGVRPAESAVGVPHRRASDLGGEGNPKPPPAPIPDPEPQVQALKLQNKLLTELPLKQCDMQRGNVEPASLPSQEQRPQPAPKESPKGFVFEEEPSASITPQPVQQCAGFSVWDPFPPQAAGGEEPESIQWE